MVDVEGRFSFTPSAPENSRVAILLSELTASHLRLRRLRVRTSKIWPPSLGASLVSSRRPVLLLPVQCRSSQAAQPPTDYYNCPLSQVTTKCLNFKPKPLVLRRPPRLSTQPWNGTDGSPDRHSEGWYCKLSTLRVAQTVEASEDRRRR